MRVLDKERGGVQRGVDFFEVRRCDVPSQRPCVRGAFERAQAMLASTSQRKVGVNKLHSEVYVVTSRKTRMSIPNFTGQRVEWNWDIPLHLPMLEEHSVFT